MPLLRLFGTRGGVRERQVEGVFQPLYGKLLIYPPGCPGPLTPPRTDHPSQFVVCFERSGGGNSGLCHQEAFLAHSGRPWSTNIYRNRVTCI